MNAMIFVIACAGLISGAPEDGVIHFVREGEPVAVRYAAREWGPGDGFVHLKGAQKHDYLYADCWER